MTEELWDAIVVGAGAGGGMSAYVLAQAGLRVLLLEAGRDYKPERETPMFDLPEKAPLFGASTPDKPFGYYDATVGGGWDVPGEPYTLAPGSAFRWYRARMLGGRTNHWGRISLRMGPYDFNGRSRDGHGADWPISYDDLAPWYDRVEKLIGLCGGQEDLENAPSSPSAQPAPPMRPYEYLIKRALDGMNIPTAAIRSAILTQPLGDRPACLYATYCYRGCSIRANFQSTTVLLPPAVATGNLEIRTNSFVHKVLVGQEGRATGVAIIDRKTGQRYTARAKAVVLAASACESARILLNSRDARHPAGLANESGQVGRNLMDSVIAYGVAQVPALEGLPPRNDDGISSAHIYAPWWGHAQQTRGELDFPRGYHIDVSGGRFMPAMAFAGIVDICDAPHGRELREEMRRKFGTIITFSGNGEMLPNDDCYCDLDPTVTDDWGVPVPRFHWKWGDSEIRQASHMRKTFLEIMRRLGGNVLVGGDTDGVKAITRGGEAIHETGTTRMGRSPRDSVVNAHGQTWSVDNLFVMDGGVFASSSDKNPTLTILALSWRSSDYLVRKFKAGEL
ncbi:MAG: GMC family oxidoreductase [Rhizomicrobium sp.]